MSQSTPQVVVACAWYNRADYICDTVDSLLAQDFDNFEVVIVNDGSTDPSVREVLDSYDDTRLRVIHQDNTGFVGAIRRAISESSAPYVAIQGAGDISYSSRLRVQYNALRKDDSLVAVACCVSQKIYGGHNHGKIEERGVKKNRLDHADFLDKTPVTHGEVMFKRKVYDHVGEYRHFFKFAQDKDLWLRMTEHGSVLILDEVLYERRRFVVDGVSTDIEKKILQHRLADFARQAAVQRSAYGVDIVDKYGSQSGLFFSPSKNSAKALARASIKYFLSHDIRSANVLVNLSMADQVTAIGLVAYAAIKLSEKHPFLIEVVARVLKLRGIEIKDHLSSRPFIE
ncbi:glycosyltransferase [Halomonas sp. M5N1S17]|uniref:glycosyltransferase family 2 protein n=1 Tax=Halomonas alkalisoli TaxID=2907158 RepID=UPI001F3CC8E0|nr:glycosyltransferase [Halomonas alkalisoli]MCE9664974.1 glycosyltransferase [Halomonas alkalisoli]